VSAPTVEERVAAEEEITSFQENDILDLLERVAALEVEASLHGQLIARLVRMHGLYPRNGAR
jgi:hypothetical protein